MGEIGNEVKKTEDESLGIGEDGKNTRTEEEFEAKGMECARPRFDAFGTSEIGAFDFAHESENTLAIGGPEDLLYVGDEGRMQEFQAEGKRMSVI
jgi:hypothetical protein